MFNKIKSILFWPFKVDNRGITDLSFKTGAAVFLFLVIAGIILYKSISYYKFTYYDYIDAEQVVNDYFVQGNVSIEKFDYKRFRMTSGAVNLHFNSIKEKPQIVTYIEDKPPYNEDVVKRANTLFNEIGIGSAEYNNGVLIYLAANDVSFKIEVGYGLEDVITDSTAGRILDNAIYNAGGKDNISESNISSVLLSIFTDIAEITAKKYNIDISKDLDFFSWDNIKYREAQDKNALYLKILIISLSLFIILLMLSKRYVISMLIGPVIIIAAVLLFLGHPAAVIIGFFIYPLKSISRLNLDDKEYEAFTKSKKSDDVNEEEKHEVDEVNKNLLSLMIIPPKNRSYFKNMPYQFVIFYCTLFLVLFFVVVDLFMAVDYKSIKYIFTPNDNYTVKEKISLYTNAGNLKIYENVGNNTYKADKTFGKELYGINYIFRKYGINAPEIAVCAQINDNFNTIYDAQTCYKHFKLDKLLKDNGLLIYYKYNTNEHTTDLEIIAGSGLKDIFPNYVIRNIQSNAVYHSYNSSDLLNIDNNTKIIGQQDLDDEFLKQLQNIDVLQNYIKENNKYLSDEQKLISEKLDILQKFSKKMISINQVKSSYINGNAGKVLQTAVRDSAKVIAKAYNININVDTDTLLSYCEKPYETRLYTDDIKDILKLAGSIFIIIVIFILIIKFKSLRTIFLYNFMLYSIILAFILKGIFLGILIFVMIIYILYLRHIGVIGGGSGSGGRSGGKRGGSFRSGGRSSGGSRSFGGGGRSGGGGAFR